MNRLYEKYIKKESLSTLFCPGCGNGIVQVAAIHAFEELNLGNNIACVSGIGCSSWIPCYFNMDVIHSMHGRAIPMATGLKMANPDKKVLVFTGDGDCLAIGGNHILHGAARNIDITVVMVNNNIYGMTGGQKSPTTPKGAVTKTSPMGAIDEPIDGCKLTMSMGATYVARWTVAHPKQLAKAIKEGIEHKGFSFIEVLCQCPTQAGKSVYGEKDPLKIMEGYKKSTYVQNYDQNPPQTLAEVEGKTRIGLLYKDDEKEEYIEKYKNKMLKIKPEVK